MKESRIVREVADSMHKLYVSFFQRIDILLYLFVNFHVASLCNFLLGLRHGEAKYVAGGLDFYG